jgi:CheY-like chemotaxis protein
LWIPSWLKKRIEDDPSPEKRLRILAVSVSLGDRFLLQDLAKQHDWEVLFTQSPRDAFSLVSKSYFELILCDCKQHGFPWREVMDRLAQGSPQSCILLVSPVKDDYLWRDVLQHGGYDVLIRPLREVAVLHLVDAAIHVMTPTASFCSP